MAGLVGLSSFRGTPGSKRTWDDRAYEGDETRQLAVDAFQSDALTRRQALGRPGYGAWSRIEAHMGP